MEQLNVVALISGGKDSFFSILHCIANGHRIVALANLYPPDDNVDDMDSFMYQTVGHSVIPLYEKALGLPLYRQRITGSAVNHDKCYGPDEDSDETESLVPLLQKVMAAHPEINAVSTGAILSDYQRTRVESVALRLGLTPLAYLWQWPSLPPQAESSLLQDMSRVGQDSRIIKVASGGLDERFLWLNVADTRTISRLQAAAQKFGTIGDGAVLGEGGEFETLAVDGPAPLWKARIEIDEADREIVAGEAGSAAVRLRQPRVVEKDSAEDEESLPRAIPLYDPEFGEMLQSMLVPNQVQLPKPERSSQPDRLLHDGPILFMPNITGHGPDAATQTHSSMDRLSYKLSDYGHSFDDIVYTSIIVRDMADFGKINKVYGSYFTKPNPPARVTIACSEALSKGCCLAIAITSHHQEDGRTVKSGLHVQSRSYWAPANIGPYSQTITIPMRSTEGCSIIYVAGQIPLVPASMTVVQPEAKTPKADFANQSVLSLQHLRRIGQRVGARKWAAAIAFVVVPETPDIPWMSAMIHVAWSALHNREPITADESEAEDFDVWNTRNIRAHQSFGQTSSEHDSEELGQYTPPLYVVRVDALPRGCKVEWASYGLTSSSQSVPVTAIPHLQHLLNVFADRIL